MTRIDLSPEMVDRDSKMSVTVVFDGGQVDYIWIWGRPWGGGGHFNDDNPLKSADKCS